MFLTRIIQQFNLVAGILYTPNFTFTCIQVTLIAIMNFIATIVTIAMVVRGTNGQLDGELS